MEPQTEFAVVGAGVSGVCLSHYLRKCFPDKTLVILEARKCVGGTWDLFKYPGIRSDSEMFTFAYPFNPWKSTNSLARGSAIMDYLNSTVDKFDLRPYIQVNQRVVKASWSSSDNFWTLRIENSNSTAVETYQLTVRFLCMCSGYYSYTDPYVPDISGRDLYEGKVIHPQFWPENFDYAGKTVTVVGSGATAITLVPAMSEHAAHVTMLQRSPTYIFTLPTIDPVAKLLYTLFPTGVAFRLIRWFNIIMIFLQYYVCKLAPSTAKRLITQHMKSQLKGSTCDADKHFVPIYNPWEQRLCVSLDGDFFGAIRRGHVTVKTDHIISFTSKGLKLESGEELESDIVVLSTGLKILFFGGVNIEVDGKPLDEKNMIFYKGMCLNGVPNFINIFGYLNASWTLRADAISRHFCKILQSLHEAQYKMFVPRYDQSLDPSCKLEPFGTGFSSSYFKRALEQEALFPLCASRHPWKTNMWLLLDMWMLAFSPAKEKEMHFF